MSGIKENRDGQPAEQTERDAQAACSPPSSEGRSARRQNQASISPEEAQEDGALGGVKRHNADRKQTKLALGTLAGTVSRRGPDPADALQHEEGGGKIQER